LFEAEFNFHVVAQTRNIVNLLEWIHDNKIDRKTFALEHTGKIDGASRPIVFKNFDGEIDFDKIRNDVYITIRNNLGRTVKYEAIRDVWFPGVMYND